MTNPNPISAVIYGMSGAELTAAECQFFAQHNPWGFILFKRNCPSPEAVKALTAELRSITGRPETPILIDQEGGRVARLVPPHWRKPPPSKVFADLALKDARAAEHAVYLNYRLIAHDLLSLGINVDCAPMVDLLFPDSDDIIGDRAFGTTPEQVVGLARAVSRGLLEGGVLPIIKHIPGHGRARADSHIELPTVEAPLSELTHTDFQPFRALNTLPMAMTAHILYTALDAQRCATLSPAVIEIIRKDIGFDGLLMTDDLSMHALAGSFQERTTQAIHAGCDMILHCNGVLEEMLAIAQAAPALSGEALRRANAATALLQPAQTMDNAAALQELNSLVA